MYGQGIKDEVWTATLDILNEGIKVCLLRSQPVYFQIYLLLIKARWQFVEEKSKLLTDHLVAIVLQV